jgi:hypothetical protein
MHKDTGAWQSACVYYAANHVTICCAMKFASLFLMPFYKINVILKMEHFFFHLHIL